MQDKMEEWGDRIDSGLVRFIELNKDKSVVDHVRDWFEMLRYRDGIWPFFGKYDLLLTPTTAVPPFRVDGHAPREIAGKRSHPLAGWRSPIHLT